jgi:site-specific recombinase XerD
MDHALLEDFTSYLTGSGFSANTVKGYETDLKLYCRFCEDFKKEPLSEETPYFYFSYLSSRKKLSASSLERKRAALLSFSRFLKTRGKDPIINPDKIKAPKKAKTIPHHFSWKQMGEILASQDKNTALGHRNYFLIVLFFATGMRLSEVINLNPGQIEGKTGKIRVTGKGNKERILFLPQEALKEYRDYYSRFRGIIEKNGCLFFNNRQEKLSPRGAQKILEKIGKNLSLNGNCHPHAFRHSYATQLIENGADIRKVAEIMGHVSLNTTQKYTHLTRQKLKNAYEEFHPHGS